MNPETPVVLIADANVLIDLAKAGALHLLRLLADHGVADIRIPRCVYEEARREVPEHSLLALGVTVLPVSLETTFEAGKIENDHLSRQDKVVAVLALRHQGEVWTNDKPLHHYCRAKNIGVHFEFEILVRLCFEGHLSNAALVEVAARVESTNTMMRDLKLVELLKKKLKMKE